MATETKKKTTKKSAKKARNKAATKSLEGAELRPLSEAEEAEFEAKRFAELQNQFNTVFDGLSVNKAGCAHLIGSRVSIVSTRGKTYEGTISAIAGKALHLKCGKVVFLPSLESITPIESECAEEEEPAEAA